MCVCGLFEASGSFNDNETLINEKPAVVVPSLSPGFAKVISAPSCSELKSLRLSPPTQRRRKHESLNAKP